MYVSGLGHVLSISGYHMVIVTGLVFFAIRAALALVPALALRRPIKKWAAAAALVAAAFYLLLSGAEVATQRAFIMTAIVLIGVMVDRAALTLRNLALAALAVLLIAPEAVAHPSFQMSFAATLALVAAYERGFSWSAAGADTPLGARIALWGVRDVVALALGSLVAGLATTLFAAYHFHRLAPYGVLANLLAMHIVSLVAMPSGILALVALPFGFDGPLWRLMGLGIDWMIAVALWVASLPGAVGRIAAFGTGPLMLASAGLILICLLRTPLRWSGAVLAALAIAWIANVRQPDVLVADGGQAFAVRSADGRLAVMKTGNDLFAVREWLAADGDARAPGDPTLPVGLQLATRSAALRASRTAHWSPSCGRPRHSRRTACAPPSSSRRARRRRSAGRPWSTARPRAASARSRSIARTGASRRSRHGRRPRTAHGRGRLRPPRPPPPPRRPLRLRRRGMQRRGPAISRRTISSFLWYTVEQF